MLYIYTYLNVLVNSLRKEEGQGMAEYALILALVGVVLALALPALTGGIDGVFTEIVASF